MKRRAANASLLLVALAAGCRSTAKSTASADGAGAPVADGESYTPSHEALQTEPVFSAPIAAARSGHQSIVAGLVVAKRVIRVVALRQEGTSWTTDILKGAQWSPGAELTVQPAADGVAVVWRDGLGAAGGTLVLLGPHGEVRGDPIEVGAAACTTADGLAWIEPRRTGRVGVLVRAWTETVPREILTLSPDRSPTLACGTRSVFVLGDGDDDLTVDTFVSRDASGRPPTLVFHNSDFSDEEREHEAFTVGDELEIVRVGATGDTATRTVRGESGASTWRRLKHVVSEEDDIVAVDGELSRALLLFSRDTDKACPEGEAASPRLRALDVNRITGATVLHELAAADCQGQRGPFWIGTGFPDAHGPIVAWAERNAKTAQKVAPISALAFRTLRPDGIAVGQIAVSADALVEGGCDDASCFAAALLRRPGSDGMSPGPIAVLKYP